MRTGNLTKSTQGQVTGPRDFFEAMRDEMNRMFGSLDFGRDDWPRVLASPDGTDMIAPDLDVHETDTAITIEAELPGVDEKDVSVTVANGVLTVKGEKKAEREEKQKNYYVSERSFGSFARSIRLPGTVDDGKIEAHIEKGVLKITVAKRADACPHRTQN